VGDDGLTVPGTEDLPTADQAGNTAIDLILAHPDIAAAVIIAILCVVFVKKYPVLSAIVGTAVVTMFLVKAAG
jgi:predicted naringenin-chalcone synthase